MRGYEITTAVQKIEKFNQLCAVSEVLPLRDRIIVKAAKIYADLESKGERIGDPDCLIAATALINGLSVCTNNERHFMRIDGLNVVNWLK